MERLQKVMAHAGIASRRKSEDIISEGRVKVNNKTVTELGFKVDPAADNIEVDGKLINREKRVYILLNKPTSYITTVDDPRGRNTVLDLLPELTERIYPVGRLDYDSSGLLLLTNDGDLTYFLTHPSHEIDKKYQVEVAGTPQIKDFQRLENGVELAGEITAPAQVSAIEKRGNKTLFNITIHEGRNRQVRRMCDKIGYSVISLRRLAIAFLTIEGLHEGEFRYLSESEVKRLKNLENEFVSK